MQILKVLGFVLIILWIYIPPFVFCLYSLEDTISHSQSNRRQKEATMQDKMITSHEMTSSIQLHGILLWASTGFFMPMGILAIRMATKFHENALKMKVFFYLHVIFQILAVLMATAGAIMSIRTLENSFDNNHQRLGLTLFAAIWLHFLTGVFKPSRGSKKRAKWFIVHWMFGTIISIGGIINIYTGIRAYQHKTARDTSLWIIFFTAELSCLVLFYIFQDKWEHFQKQRVSVSENNTTTNNNNPNGNDQIIQVVTRNQPIISCGDHEQRIIVPESCDKRNALKNLFE